MVAISGSGWKLAPSLVLLDKEVTAAFPNRDHSADGSIGDLSHQSRESDHNPEDGWVDALDIDEDLSDTTHSLMPFAERLRMLEDPRVKYLIYEGRICKGYVDSAGHPAWQWYPYAGLNDHAHHLHVSVENDGRFDLRSWGFAAAYTSAPAAPLPPPVDLPEGPPMVVKRKQNTEHSLLLADGFAFFSDDGGWSTTNDGPVVSADEGAWKSLVDHYTYLKRLVKT